MVGKREAGSTHPGPSGQTVEPSACPRSAEIWKTVGSLVPGIWGKAGWCASCGSSRVEWSGLSEVHIEDCSGLLSSEAGVGLILCRRGAGGPCVGFLAREGVTMFLSYQPSMFTSASWLELPWRRGSEPCRKATNCLSSVSARAVLFRDHSVVETALEQDLGGLAMPATLP